MNKVALLSLVLFFSLQFKAWSIPVSKDTIYLDEAGKSITIDKFYKKESSPIFHYIRFIEENRVTLKLRLSCYFGKFDKNDKQLFFKRLNTNNSIDTTKIAVIHYQDTLKSPDHFPIREVHLYSNDANNHEHIIKYRQFIRYRKNCDNLYKKYKKTDIYHYFKVNTGHTLKHKELEWFEDPSSIICETFSDEISEIKQLIINPNGEYFVLLEPDNYLRDISMDLAKGDSWKTHQHEYKTLLYKLNL